MHNCVANTSGRVIGNPVFLNAYVVGIWRKFRVGEVACVLCFWSRIRQISDQEFLARNPWI